MYVVVVLNFCFVDLFTADAAVINIPEDYDWIQTGIDSAGSGDTVLVQPGIYYETLVFHGAGVTLASLYLLNPDPEYIDSTIIDAARQQRAIDFRHAGDSSAVLCGFTILNGGTSYGGGVYCAFSSPTLRDLVIENCQTYRMGGGIYCTQESRPLIINVRINGNSSPVGGGIGIAHNAHPTLINCEIRGNTADNIGGGIFIGHEFANITTDGVLIAENHGGLGGGVYITDSPDVVLENVTISSNTSDNGSALYITHDFWECAVELINSIVYFHQDPSIILTGDTLVPGTVLTIRYSDVEGGPEEIVSDEQSRAVWGRGNIAHDPYFVNAEEDDYHLTAGSPCIDRGDPASEDDPDGSRADMGAFFFDRRINSAQLEHKSPAPDRFGLISVFPNPFNSNATVSYNLQYATDVSIRLFSSNGSYVKIIFEGRNEAGINSSQLAARGLPSGLYVLKMEYGDRVSTRKVSVME